jgi:bifunctional UDP-N-acetylglucosamine pyrophosphorylase / glucosamine-1-phosphate N-acetyltransferase
MQKDCVIILAGGKGTRMEEASSKALIELRGKPLLGYVTENTKALGLKTIIIVGYRGQEVIEKMGDGFTYAWQHQQLGTGDAVQCAKKELADKNLQRIIVLPGDHPLIGKETIKSLLDQHEKAKASLSLATVTVENFEGDNKNFFNCGRIIRDDSGRVKSIVELKDATKEQKAIKEVNVSYYCFDANWLWDNIDKLKNDNAAKEYYITDLVKIAVDQGEKIGTVSIKDPREGLGVNTKEQLEVIKKFV